MKIAFGLLGAIGISCLLLYQFGGYATFDPTKQGLEAKEAIKPGMPWTTVIDICKGPPQEYRIITPDPRTKLPREGPPLPFDAKQLENDLAGQALPHGFVFTYKFSEKIAFSVVFSEKGNSVGMHDVRTMADLLQTR
jgi:hypothetical protein